MNAINHRTTARADSGLAPPNHFESPLPRSRRSFGRLGQTGACVALSLASAACSVSATPPRVLSAETGATGAPVCHVTSPAKVLARHVFVPGGVEASAQDGGFSVRFATARSRCVAVDWPSVSERPEPASCPTTGARTATRTNNAEETMLAWESHDAPEPHITLGVVTYDAPHAFFGLGIEGMRQVVQRTFHAPATGPEGGETAPDLAPLGHDRFLLAWVDGNAESHQLRAQSVVGWGDPLGAAMILSPAEVSVIGRPSVVVAPTGYGLVTYVASMNGEFDVLATPIACALN
jgi:hypothetical protein